MLHLAMARPEIVSGLVGIAAAPDFTEDMMWNAAGEDAKAQLLKHKVWRQPSPDGQNETIITLQLIEDGRKHLVLRDAIPVKKPVRLIHGTDDNSVPWITSAHLMEQLTSSNVTLTLVKGGHHRMSKPEHIALILQTVAGLITEISQA